MALTNNKHYPVGGFGGVGVAAASDKWTKLLDNYTNAAGGDPAIISRLKEMIARQQSLVSNPMIPSHEHLFNYDPEYTGRARPLLRLVTSQQSNDRQSEKLLRMVAMRMHRDAPEGSVVFPNFDFIAAHRKSDDKVVLFIVIKDQAVQLEDGFDLFPSDKLITQLRVLK